MKIAPSILLAIAAMLERRWLPRLEHGPSLAYPAPRPLAERTFDVDTFVADHNRTPSGFRVLKPSPRSGFTAA